MMKIALTLTVLSAGLLLAADGSRVDASEKVRDLYKEYIGALEQAADLLTAEYKNDRRSYEELFQGRLRVLNAKLDAAETAEERVKFRESMVDLMKEKETFLVQALKFEKVDKLKVLNAKADRIKAEIALEQAKGNGVDQPKQ
jgi:hypothetical protein